MVETRPAGVLIATAAASSFAILTSALLYRLWLVPRLPSLHHVPLHWWLLVGAPVMLVFFVCGWSARSPKSLGLLAAVAFLPLPVWQIAFSFVANTPIGHDLKVTDLAYWAGLVIQFLICVSIAVLGAGFSWVARRPTAA